jgi:hypothetical protein
MQIILNMAVDSTWVRFGLGGDAGTPSDISALPFTMEVDFVAVHDVVAI